MDCETTKRGKILIWGCGDRGLAARMFGNPLRSLLPVVTASAALALSACSAPSTELWSPFDDDDDLTTISDDPSVPSSTFSAPGQQTLALGDSSFQATNAAQFSDTGTVVGRRVRELQSDLTTLSGSTNGHNARLQEIRAGSIASAQEYYGIIAAINARLQVGTTPGNPILQSQWAEAQIALDSLSQDLVGLNTLASTVAGDSSLAAFLVESVRATYGLSGAVDEDHRQLAVLEDEVQQTAVLIDRLLTEISEDITRQSTYLSSERANLRVLQTAIANGELYGSSLTNRVSLQGAAGASLTEYSQTAARPLDANAADALVIIRFTTNDVRYQQPLYQAVSSVLEIDPNARFDLVAVNPEAGNPAATAVAASQARDRAEQVLRTLVDFGLPTSRVAISRQQVADAPAAEVRLFVR